MNTLFFETFYKKNTTQLGENEDENNSEDAENAEEDAEDEVVVEVDEKTQLGKLINELTEIIDNFELPPEKVEK